MLTEMLKEKIQQTKYIIIIIAIWTKKTNICSKVSQLTEECSEEKQEQAAILTPDVAKKAQVVRMRHESTKLLESVLVLPGQCIHQNDEKISKDFNTQKNYRENLYHKNRE